MSGTGANAANLLTGQVNGESQGLFGNAVVQNPQSGFNQQSNPVPGINSLYTRQGADTSMQPLNSYMNYQRTGFMPQNNQNSWQPQSPYGGGNK